MGDEAARRGRRTEPLALIARAQSRLVIAVVAAALVLGSAPGRVLGQPSEADVFVAEGILALEDKQFDLALEHFRRALQRDPEHLEALYYSGLTHLARSEPGQAVPFLERARQKAPMELSVAFQLGVAYFALQQYDRAEPLLEEVFARQPTLDGLGYYLGYLRYRKEDYQGALRAFRAGRTSDPSLAQLTRFYTGLSLAALGLPAQAAAEVEQALRLQPASPLTRPAERLRDALLTPRQRDRRLRLVVGLGVFYDDNVTARPDPKANDATVHDLRRPRHTSTGETFSLRSEYDWLRRGAWESTVGYSFFTTYNNDLPSFNIMDHLLTTALSYRTTVLDMPLQTTAQYAFDYLLLDEEEFVQRHAGSLTAVLTESARHITSALARIESKEYSEVRPLARAEFQDGVNYLAGALHLLRFAEDRFIVKGGYQIDREDAIGKNHEYLGHRFLAGALWVLPWRGLRLSYDLNLHYRDYLHRHTTLPDAAPGTKERSDHEYNHLIRVELPLPRGFILSADYQATRNRSNLPSFSYTRNVINLGVLWQY